MKLRQYVAIASLLLMAMAIAVNVYQHKKIQQLTIERDTYQQNTYGLMTGMESLRNDSALQACQIQLLQLSIEEYKLLRDEDVAIIQELKLKLKNVNSVSKQQLTVEAPIVAPVVDTLVVHDSIPVKQQTVSMHNEHIAFDGIIENDSLKAQVNIPINLTQIIHKIPKHKFLWWSWGCKSVKQIITTDNPYVHLNYMEYIELKK